MTLWQGLTLVPSRLDVTTLCGHIVWSHTYAVLVGGSNGDGARRGLVTIVKSIDPRPYNFQVTVCNYLIYTVTCMNDRLFTQANPNPRLPPHPICVVDSSSDEND